MSERVKEKLSQNPLARLEPCEHGNHQIIPINVQRCAKDVHVISLCQKCGLVAQTLLRYPEGYEAP